MKKLSLLALVAAGLLLGACSDKDEAQQTAVNPGEFEDGAYIGISLSLPSADNSTRANDDLSNGTEDEFTVYNATLYIFKGDIGGNEKDATFVRYVSLGTKYEKDQQPGINPDEWNVQTGVDVTKITSTSLSEATRIPNDLAATIKADNTHQYYAYVILNHNSQLPTLTETSTFENFSKEEFSKIGADIAAVKNVWPSGLLMTNAPICNYPGGTAAPTKGTATDPDLKYSTLVPLDNQKIFSSAAEAKSKPAACVYVERAAVKITVDDNLGAATLDGYNVSLVGWQIINNEKTFFNTRHINYNGTAAEDWGPYYNESATPSTAVYRFVSNYQFEPQLPTGLVGPNATTPYSHTVGYRTYFAYDPHYNTDATNDGAGNTTLDNTVATEDRYITVADGKTHAYTTENTFDVVHQTWRNTTMVTLKVQLSKTPSGSTTATYPDFYTVGKGGQTMFEETDAESTLHNLILNDPTVSSKLSALLTKFGTRYSSTTIASVLTVDITTPSAATTGVVFSWSMAFTSNGSSISVTSAEQTEYDELATAINEFIHPTESGVLQTTKYNDPVLVSYYKSGVSYYNVRIQHFGEKETPWDAGGDYVTGSGVNVNQIYGIGQTTDKSKERFLGRYGLVRDNWYKLDINGITKIGSATPVDPSITSPDTPDDEIENYISVHVHIVPWVLRQQTVIL